MIAHYIYVQTYGSDEMHYRGTLIKLSKKYVDYDDYKNDPENVHPSEYERIERMMMGVQIASEFESWSAFMKEVRPIGFPGYGSGGARKTSIDGRTFLLNETEIPPGGKSRYILLESGASGRLSVLDDFAAQTGPLRLSIVRDGDDLAYIDRDAKVVRRIPWMVSRENQ